MAKEKTTVAEGDIPSLEVPAGSAITVITNTVESLRSHYPGLVSEIENAALAKAKPEWINTERQRLADLNAAFADDPKFANDSFVAGLSVEQAKAKRHDDLVAKLKEAEAKIIKAREEVPAVVSDGERATEPTTNAAGEPLSQIEAAARAQWNKDPNIEKEFGNFKTFLAYKRNMDNVRVLTRDTAAK